MTYKVAQEIHPNNETRLTLWKVRSQNGSLKNQAAAFLGVAADSVADLAASNSGDRSPLTFVLNSEGPQITCQAHSYRRTKFGLDAARRIMRAAGAMDRWDAEIGNFLFLTATLPGNTDEAKWAIANYSHLLIDRLKSWFSWKVKDRKEFYVWEHQDRGALHFHYCIHVPDESIKQRIEKGFKRQWVRLLDGIDSEFGTNVWGKWAGKTARYKTGIIQARVERVYSSVGAYMAGYLSGKGSKHGDDEKHYWYPKRWFGVSRPLSKLVQEHTEKRVDEFGTLQEANEFWHKKVEVFSDEVLTERKYPHKVGEGKTHVFYHTRIQQAKLWLENLMLTHSPLQHPNIHAMISTVLRATLDGQKLCMHSKSWRAVLSPKSYGYFEDATWLVSLRRSALSQTHIRSLTETFSKCEFPSGSDSLTSSFGQSLRRANNLISHYHSQMSWNQHGWLNNLNDFNRGVDISPHGLYARTSAERRSDTPGVDSSSPHVGSEPKPGYSQLSFL